MSKDSLKEAADLIRAGQRQQAQPILTELLRDEPENSQAWYLLSYTLEDKKRQEYALTQALRADPQFERARSRLQALRGGPVAPPRQAALEPTQPAPPAKPAPVPVPEPEPIPDIESAQESAFFSEDLSLSPTDELRAEATQAQPTPKPGRVRRLIFVLFLLVVLALAAYFGPDLLSGVTPLSNPTATPLASRTLPPTWTPTTLVTSTSTPVTPTLTPSLLPTVTETSNPLP